MLNKWKLYWKRLRLILTIKHLHRFVTWWHILRRTFCERVIVRSISESYWDTAYLPDIDPALPKIGILFNDILWEEYLGICGLASRYRLFPLWMPEAVSLLVTQSVHPHKIYVLAPLALRNSAPLCIQYLLILGYRPYRNAQGDLVHPNIEMEPLGNAFNELLTKTLSPGGRITIGGLKRVFLSEYPFERHRINAELKKYFSNLPNSTDVDDYSALFL